MKDYCFYNVSRESKVWKVFFVEGICISEFLKWLFVGSGFYFFRWVTLSFVGWWGIIFLFIK